MKKLLMLGGADIQISAIKKAKELGYHVITCDYLPENPGHKFSDEYHNVSTTDVEAVFQLAARLKIDGISSYASDPGAVTAAYVSEKLKIPGNPLAAVRILSDKITFRTIQKELGLRHPDYRFVESADDIVSAVKLFNGKAILKPADTSGSKGIVKLDSESQDWSLPFVDKVLKEARDYSRSKRIIVEEFIVRKGFLMSGDFLIEKGQIQFMCFGDVHFNGRINGLVPRSISLPASKDQVFFSKVKRELQTLITGLNIKTGVFNADVIEDQQGQAVVIDIGARNGGNMFNDIISYHSGVDLIGLSMKQCVGEPIEVVYDGAIKGYYAHNVIHSERDGLFESLTFSKELEPLIIFKSFNLPVGSPVNRFVNSSFRLGLILLRFDNFDQMHKILGDIHKHVTVKLIQKK